MLESIFGMLPSSLRSLPFSFALPLPLPLHLPPFTLCSLCPLPFFSCLSLFALLLLTFALAVALHPSRRHSLFPSPFAVLPSPFALCLSSFAFRPSPLVLRLSPFAFGPSRSLR